ncbi:MAG: glycine zipper domain-containing protein [Ferruginibacter sp.]
MKKIILGLAVIALFANCRNNKSGSDKDNVVLLQDTMARYNNSILTDKGQDDKTYGSTIGAAVGKDPAITQHKNNSNSGNNNVSNTSSANTGSGTVAAAPAPAKKKGWSHRARGAAVGAGAGAVTGAIVNKNNRGVGAVVGAVVGAATGYVIGNEVDKKKKP